MKKNKHDIGTRLLIGALAGLAGTLVMDALRNTSQKAVPGAEPPMKVHPGKYFVKKGEQVLPGKLRRKIPRKAEEVAAKSLGVGYGMTFGALYSVLRPRGGKLVRDGVALGLLNWAIGFLGWLPKTGIMPPIQQQEPKQIAMPIAQHAVYGTATVAAYDLLVATV
ncbi:MAG TPA: hypothetical protein VG754_00145 [Verrucomicrobiae bacterium]|nr:hypothetical protein [Verrucomicrobiae bacterium]